MFIIHRDVDESRPITIIDTKDDLETHGRITEVVVMLPSGKRIRLSDAPDGVDGFEIIGDLARTVIEPQASNVTRIWFRGPTD